MANRVICAKRIRSLVVTCVRGAAWITWEGSGDHVLEPGQSMEIRDARGFCLEILRQGEALLAERASDGQVGSLTEGVPPARSFSAA